MSKVEALRASVQQRLAAAAEEIFQLFEKTLSEQEQELCGHTPGLLRAAFSPAVRLHRADVQQLLLGKEVDPSEQQKRSISLNQEDNAKLLPHCKQEEEMLWSSQEGEQLRGLKEADSTYSTVTALPSKSEEDSEDEPKSSQLHQSSQTEENRDAECLKTEADGESCGASEPDRNLNPDHHLQPDTQDKMSQSSEPEETKEPQLDSELLQNHKEPVSEMKRYLEKKSVGASEHAVATRDLCCHLQPPESFRSTTSEMMEAEMQRREVAASKRKNVATSSSDDEDSDVERNFALLTERGGGGGGGEGAEQQHGGEEEEEFSDKDEESDDGNEDEDGSDSGQEESDGSEKEEDDVEEDGDGGASDDDDDDDDDDEDEDEDEAQEDAGGSSEIQTREDIKKELSSMSFEDILKLQNKVGTKVYNEVAYGSSKSKETQKKKRLNKNRPMEVSAKRPAPFLRQVVGVRKPTWRDPRFDDLSGEYKPEIFEKTYKFISDIRHREKEIVQKQLKKTKKNEKKKEKLQFLLKRMENQERARKSREQQRERELEFKRQQRERANQGTRPFFLKNSEKKKLQLAEKYQELKKSGKLENFLSKKRKRNAGKDRRKLPRQLQKKAA